MTMPTVCRRANPERGLDPLVARHVLSGDVTREALEIAFERRPAGRGGPVRWIRRQEGEPLTAGERSLLARLPEVLDLGWGPPRWEGRRPERMETPYLTDVLIRSPALDLLDRRSLFSLLDRGLLRVLRMPAVEVPVPPPLLRTRPGRLQAAPDGTTYALAKAVADVDVRRLTPRRPAVEGQAAVPSGGGGAWGGTAEIQSDLWGSPRLNPAATACPFERREVARLTGRLGEPEGLLRPIARKVVRPWR